MHETIALLVERDPVFSPILDRYGPPNIITRPQGFESMCKTILEQQVSLESARACIYKLMELAGGFLPEAILECTTDEFRSCGISRQKTVYLRALAEAVTERIIDFDSFSKKDPVQIRQELIRIKGIGNWTIDIYLMFSLQSPDILPLGDIGIISVMKELWGFETIEEMTAHSQQWAPYRTTAAFLLWHYYLEKRGRKFPY
ncbi:MAG: DNA-3-methyladenine glycosylase 2 family protein [Flavobacterium sp.]|nr:MAG: DNA-3-methyladenine glycosylase 2 family protein [Flavobacterium sp.]